MNSKYVRFVDSTILDILLAYLKFLSSLNESKRYFEVLFYNVITRDNAIPSPAIKS